MLFLIRNVVSLSVVHIVRLVLPVVLMPLLTHRVSGETFGLYLFSISLAVWFSLLIEYGFNLSGTRLLSQSDCDKEKLKIISSINSAKVILFFLSMPIIILLYAFIPMLEDNPIWLLCSWLGAACIGFTPIFYFQGAENTKPLAYIEVLCGLLMLGFIYVLVKSDAEKNIIIYAFLLGRSASLILSMFLVKNKFGYNIFRFDFKEGVSALAVGRHCFIMQSLSTLYTSFNIVFLGFWVGALQVAIYGGAERLVRAGLGFVSQASNAVFPRVSRIKIDRPSSLDSYRFWVLFVFAGVGFLGAFLAYVLSPAVVIFLFNGKLNGAIPVVQLMSWSIPAIAISNVLAFQYLLVDGKEKILSIVIGGGGGLSLFLAFILVPKYGYIGMAVTWVTVEWILSVLLLAILYIIRSKRSFFKFKCLELK